MLLTINGRMRDVDAAPTDHLLGVLRNQCSLMAARFGCGEGECGACAVLVDGEAKPSCTAEVGNLSDKAIVTVEGLGTSENPHPLQRAILDLQAGQCGYCLSGIIIAAKALLDRNPDPSRKEIAAALSGHLCRCGVHNRIIAAVQQAARQMARA